MIYIHSISGIMRSMLCEYEMRIHSDKHTLSLTSAAGVRKIYPIILLSKLPLETFDRRKSSSAQQNLSYYPIVVLPPETFDRIKKVQLGSGKIYHIFLLVWGTLDMTRFLPSDV